METKFFNNIFVIPGLLKVHRNLHNSIRVQITILLLLLHSLCCQHSTSHSDNFVFDNSLHGSWTCVAKSGSEIPPGFSGSLTFTDSCFVAFDTVRGNGDYSTGDFEIQYCEGLWYTVYKTLNVVALFFSRTVVDTGSHWQKTYVDSAAFSSKFDGCFRYSIRGGDTLFLQISEGCWLKHVKN